MSGYYGARPEPQRHDHLSTRIAHTIEHDAVVLLKIWKVADILGAKALKWAESYHAGERGADIVSELSSGNMARAAVLVGKETGHPRQRRSVAAGAAIGVAIRTIQWLTAPQPSIRTRTRASPAPAPASPASPATSSPPIRPSDLSNGNGHQVRFAHYVERDMFVHSRRNGTPVTLLCGNVWVPSGDPMRYSICKAAGAPSTVLRGNVWVPSGDPIPICPACKKIYGRRHHHFWR